MKLYKYTLISILLILTIAVTGCSQKTEELKDPNKLQIVASLFPQYDFAKQIGGDFVQVSLILPPGVEAHAFDPKPKDIIVMSEADILLYTSDAMEPWVKDLIENIDVNQTQIIDLSKNITLLASDHEDEEGEEHEDEEDENHEDESQYDPHYWLDPQNAILMVETITNELIKAMPEQDVYFLANAEKLTADLMALDEEIQLSVEKMTSKTILSGGHFAFGYFAHRYGLEHVSPYNGFSPDAEPLSKEIKEMMNTITTTNAKAIFYEELIDPRVAKTISEQTGVELLLLHGAHNLSKKELKDGVTYLEIMKGNLERLKVGLNFNE